MRIRQVLRSVVPWLAVGVPLVEVGLVLADVLPVGTALAVAVALEVLLAWVFLAEATLFRGAYRRTRQAGGTRGSAVLAGAEAALPRPVYWVVRSELGVLRALGRALRRRTVVRPGEEAFSYTSRIGVVLGTVIGLTPVEIGVVHLLLPWPTVRWVVFALAVYGLLWLIGFSLSLRQNPHTLDADALTLRFGQLRTVRVRLADVVAARVAATDGAKRNLEVTDDQVALSVMGETSVRLTLRLGSTVDLDGQAVPAEAVALFADDARRLVRELRTRLADPVRN
ncbi:hypothetical protein [uncultured Modestobacter sp.]|uniref:hypothetical protein n=1 Tax=uncultured Modestobacter sp. TaxID=380048 RepID=UPI00260DCB8F|nr:hypothetical protein [uncultured Modestobacter sp.]